jgi:glycosyltransferase involved in cell wall biosynthesis
MAHGKPVVHFDLPELTWIPAECGVKVAPFDVGGLVRAVEELSCDTARRTRLGRNARAYAERHNAAATDDAYATLVAEVLTGRTVGTSGRSPLPERTPAGETSP